MMPAAEAVRIASISFASDLLAMSVSESLVWVGSDEAHGADSAVGYSFKRASP
jgi:hypothetical protein